MKSLSPTWLIGALPFTTLISQTIANHGIIVELHLRKSDILKRGTNEGLLFEIRDASIIADGALLAERSDNSTLVQIEEIVQKRQTANNNKNGGACKKPKTDQEKKEQGKCPDGKKLDPAVPGQDEFTENPKCVDKDSTDCPAGQSKSSPAGDKPSRCAPDDDPDKKCDNEPDTVLFKEIGPDGKMKSSCRSTKEKEEKKKKLLKGNQDVVRDIYAEKEKTDKENAEKEKNDKEKAEKEKNDKEKAEKEKNDKERQRRVRARRGACLALGALSFIPKEDVDKLTDDEISGLQEPEFDGTDPIPGIDLEDYMITLTRPPKMTVEMETAGFGGSIAKFIESLFNAGKAVSKAANLFKGAVKSPGGERFAKLRNPEKTTPATKGAVDAAKGSDVVKRIVTSDTFLDCVALGAITAAELGTAVNGHAKRDSRPAESQRKITNINAGGYLLTIDLDAEKTDQHPVDESNADRAILLVADDSEDARDHDNEPRILLQTWADSYHRGDRAYYQACNSLRGSDQNNKWTLVQVWGGCCNFYNGENCEADTSLFAMTNREDGDLHGNDNNSISSFWCTFDELCHGAPGLPPV